MSLPFVSALIAPSCSSAPSSSNCLCESVSTEGTGRALAWWQTMLISGAGLKVISSCIGASISAERRVPDCERLGL
jgi:hypothetical protein